jgi:cytochrome P450
VGNRDPEVFQEPNRFRLDRGVSREMAFGGGARICPGRYFARMLAEAAVRSVTASHVEITVTTDENLWVEGSMLRQLKRLPVLFTKVS